MSLVLLLAATSVLSTGFTTSATAVPWTASYSHWYTNSTQDRWRRTNYQWQTPCLCNPNDPNCLCYPNYPYYQNYPSYGYGVVTETVTATSYSTVTQTSDVTSTTTSIPAPVTASTTVTDTTTTTTSDTTAETLYSTLMAVFLALFLATLVLLVGSRYRGSKGSNPQSPQAASAPPAQAHMTTSYRCSACKTDVDLGSKFCGSCGARLKSK